MDSATALAANSILSLMQSTHTQHTSVTQFNNVGHSTGPIALTMPTPVQYAQANHQGLELLSTHHSQEGMKFPTGNTRLIQEDGCGQTRDIKNEGIHHSVTNSQGLIPLALTEASRVMEANSHLPPLVPIDRQAHQIAMANPYVTDMTNGINHQALDSHDLKYRIKREEPMDATDAINEIGPIHFINGTFVTPTNQISSSLFQTTQVPSSTDPNMVPPIYVPLQNLPQLASNNMSIPQVRFHLSWNV